MVMKKEELRPQADGQKTRVAAPWIAAAVVVALAGLALLVRRRRKNRM